jgi:hypothetical protein
VFHRERRRASVVGSTRESPMCWKCEEVEQSIEHFRRLRKQASSNQSLKGLDILIAKLDAEKREFHADGLALRPFGE